MAINWFLPQCSVLLHKRWLQSHTERDNTVSKRSASETWPQWSRCICRRQSDDRIQKRRKSEMEREESKSISLFLSRERIVTASLSPPKDRKKKMNFLSLGRESLFLTKYLSLPTSYFSEKDYDVSVCGRLWCHSSMVVLELPSVLDTKQLVLHC